MDKCGSVIDRMNMKLGSKFLNTLGIQTQLIKRLQCVIVVNDATHSQKDGVDAFVLLLHGAQLVLKSRVLTVLDLGGIDVTMENADNFGSVLSGESGFANGWRCC